MKVEEIEIDKNNKKVLDQYNDPHTIFVVEDDPVTFRIIHKHLQKAGFHAEGASTGSEAITWLVQNPNTLLLLDYELPDMTGDQVIKTLAERNCTVPFIILTGHGDEKLAVKMMKLGARDYMIKEKGFHKLLLPTVNHVIAQLETVKKLTEAEEELQRAQKETEQLLSSISSILIGVDDKDKIIRWNKTAEQTFGIKANKVVGKSFIKCGIKWDWNEVLKRIAECKHKEQSTSLDDIRFTRSDGKEGFLAITVNPIASDTTEPAGYLLLTSEITDRKILESQLVQAQKLESIGQLAAGIAHEINTPTQYVGDNTRFLAKAFEKLIKVSRRNNELLMSAKTGTLSEELIAEIEKVNKENKVEYLVEEIPSAIEETLNGVGRIAKIVKAMKEYSHPGVEEKSLSDINKALDSTITVARNEWKYHAELIKNFNPSLPLVPCLPGELNQVFLNIIVNAAHAISDANQELNRDKGLITISTDFSDEHVEIRISDTGTGIPKEYQTKIFDPFFTSKEVGKGTGQGLAISHNVIVEKHNGSLSFETEEGKGTAFIIRLPLN